MSVSGRTDVGPVMFDNEDSFLITSIPAESTDIYRPSFQQPFDITYNIHDNAVLLAVADGTGVFKSVIDVNEKVLLSLENHLSSSDHLEAVDSLKTAIEQANKMVYNRVLSNPNQNGMGIALTVALIKGSSVYFAQVGDTRSYVFRNGKLVQVTVDQTLAQRLVYMKEITNEEAKTHLSQGVMLQAIGTEEVSVGITHVELNRDDYLLLCTSGLWINVKHEEIEKVLLESKHVKTACEELIRLANQSERAENITVLIAEAKGKGLNESKLSENLEVNQIIDIFDLQGEK